MDLIEIAGGLLGGIFGNNGAKKEAARNRAFQERMARHAHRYEAEDLRLAGMNPILTALGGQGASTPGGATANVKDPITPAIATGQQARMTNEQVKLLQEQTAKTESEKNLANTTHDTQWRMNDAMRLPNKELQSLVASGKASGFEVMQWANIQNNLANLNATLKGTARAQAETEVLQNNAKLQQPELEFNRDTGNSATWLKNFMRFIQTLK